jgi:hypothetical protein
MTQYIEKMTVKNGKFFKGKNEVPIEHGNKEQIQLLKRVEEMRDGFDPEISIKKKIIMEFQCVCGSRNEFDSFTELDEDDPDFLIAGETDTCHCCGLRFKVIRFQTQHSDFLQLKLMPKE